MSKRLTVEQRLANLETAVSRFYQAYDVTPNNPLARRVRELEQQVAELKRAAQPVAPARLADTPEPQREAA